MLSPSLTLVLWFKSSKPLFWDPIYKAEPQSPFQNRPVTKLRPNNMIFLLCGVVSVVNEDAVSIC